MDLIAAPDGDRVLHDDVAAELASVRAEVEKWKRVAEAAKEVVSLDGAYCACEPADSYQCVCCKFEAALAAAAAGRMSSASPPR